jgi:ATP synthase F1 delta subunit
MKSKKEIVKVITPFPLTARQRQIIFQKLAPFAGDTHLKIKEKVDPSLIGGVIIMWRDLYIDCSLKTQLEKLKKELL